jgi:hypothetical protein
MLFRTVKKCSGRENNLLFQQRSPPNALLQLGMRSVVERCIVALLPSSSPAPQRLLSHRSQCQTSTVTDASRLGIDEVLPRLPSKGSLAVKLCTRFVTSRSLRNKRVPARALRSRPMEKALHETGYNFTTMLVKSVISTAFILSSPL